MDSYYDLLDRLGGIKEASGWSDIGGEQRLLRVMTLSKGRGVVNRRPQVDASLREVEADYIAPMRRQRRSPWPWPKPRIDDQALMKSKQDEQKGRRRGGMTMRGEAKSKA